MPTKEARLKVAGVPKNRLVKLVKAKGKKKPPRYLRDTIWAERGARP